jgi:hypothetical protein
MSENELAILSSLFCHIFLTLVQNQRPNCFFLRIIATPGKAIGQLLKSMHLLTTLCKPLHLTRLTRGVSIRSMAFTVDFEVAGEVQGVFFRACTEKKAKELGLVGWVMNTPLGTVKGTAQSDDKKSLDQFKVGDLNESR